MGIEYEVSEHNVGQMHRREPREKYEMNSRIPIRYKMKTAQSGILSQEPMNLYLKLGVGTFRAATACKLIKSMVRLFKLKPVSVFASIYSKWF